MRMDSHAWGGEEGGTHPVSVPADPVWDARCSKRSWGHNPEALILC
ncbi:MAG: hypothetical protein CM15mP18_3980 [Methanobacteriota archaeon]|nr:MAG: hypothetical protein CM15mP18_3980 [Euryarchaeota archaeon]